MIVLIPSGNIPINDYSKPSITIHHAPALQTGMLPGFTPSGVTQEWRRIPPAVCNRDVCCSSIPAPILPERYRLSDIDSRSILKISSWVSNRVHHSSSNHSRSKRLLTILVSRHNIPSTLHLPLAERSKCVTSFATYLPP